MDTLTIYADPKTPNQRVYQLDEKTSGEAFFDMLDAFRGAAFQHDLGTEAPGKKSEHNIPGQLQAIRGIGLVSFQSPNYIVFKHHDADWDVIDPKIREIFATAFGEIKEVNVIEGSL